MANNGSNANLHRSSTLDIRKPLAATAAAPALNKADMLIEKKRASLDARHKYLLDKAAEFLDEKPASLENSLLQGNKLDQMNDFLAEGGSKRLLLVWQASAKVRLSFKKLS